MLEALPNFTQRWRAGTLSDAAYAGLYFLLWQVKLYGDRCAARKSKRSPPLRATEYLQRWRETTDITPELHDCLTDYQFFGVRPPVTRALCAWLRGDWSLQLCTYIPTPDAVLAMQAEGTRPVTVLADFPRLLRPVLGKANGYAFMVHDLEHAFKFHHDPTLHRAQVAFFARLVRAHTQGMFAPFLEDPLFVEKFAYLISDMNTHPEHGRQYLRAILLECRLRHEGKPANGRLSATAWADILCLMQRAGLDEEAVKALCST